MPADSPLAHWIWSSNGWAFKWGVLDYAGGVSLSWLPRDCRQQRV